MGNLAGEAENGGLKLHFDARLRPEFGGAKVTTDAGLIGEKRGGLVGQITDVRRNSCIISLKGKS